MTRFPRGITLLIVLCLSACSEPGESAMPYQSTSTMHDFMYWVLEPAADVIWDSAGVIITEEGETDLRPTTQEGWDHVRNSATVVAEAGNLLMMPGYRADEADWVEYSSGLIRAGLQARKAAMAQDADALFDAGGAIYNVCRACHNKYATLPQRPGE